MVADPLKVPATSANRSHRDRRALEAMERALAIDLDTELAKLLPALQRAEKGLVIALVQFRRVSFVGLIPFQLHACWPDALHWLPLTSTIAVIPFSASDEEIASFMPLYHVSDVREARRRARWARYNEKRDRPGDFQHPDWEEGVARRASLTNKILPPCAFVSIERVCPDGRTIPSPRPILGRHAGRGAPRPRVLIPGAGPTSGRAAERIASADLVIVDIQGLRGWRSLQAARSVLAVRSPTQPTLVVASSPSDLIAVGFDELPGAYQVVPIGLATELKAVDVITIGHDRLAADERFRAALSNLTGQSTAVHRVLALAEHAWWVARQGLDQNAVVCELQRFERALDDLSREDPLIAGLFKACRDLIQAAAADLNLHDERLRATVRATLNPGTSKAVLVLVPTWKDAMVLRAAIAAELDLNMEDLETLGVWVLHVHAALPCTAPGVAILAGYAGMATIDAALGSGAQKVIAIFDPVEARAAWYNAQRMARYLEKAGVLEVAIPLRRLAEGLSPCIVGFSTIKELFTDEASIPTEDRRVTVSVTRPAPSEAVVCLTDGRRLEVPIGARFEILGGKGFGSRVVPVTDLKPGDQIILLDEEGRTLLSRRRMAALDAGVLQAQCRTRSEWLAIVQAVAKAEKLTPAAIAQRMTARGYLVTPAAVAGWLTECSEEARTPMRLDYFLTFADVLGLAISEEKLRYYFRDIHTWRVQHRRAGREVAQAIRLARSGRLGPVTLARIERNWGVSVRALVDAARIGVVDEVILPEGAEDATGKADR